MVEELLFEKKTKSLCISCTDKMKGILVIKKKLSQGK